MKLKLFFLTLVFKSICFSQSSEVLKKGLNSFTLSPQIHTNFDETKILSAPFSKYGTLPVGIYFAYTRQLKSLNSIRFGLTTANYFNRYRQNYSAFGTVDKRTYTSVDVNFVRSILVSKHHKISSVFGGQFRLGQEEIHNNYFIINDYIWQCVYPTNTLLDLGVNLGAQHELFLGSHFSIESQLSYTFYPLTYDSKDSWDLEDKGAARHLLALKIGASYHFGKKKNVNKLLEKNHKAKTLKNSISVYKSIYQFFDGSPMVEDKGDYAQFGPNISGAYGVEYQGKIFRKSFWTVSIEDFEFRSDKRIDQGPNRTFTDRNFGLINVNYLKNVFQSKKSILLAQIGLSARYGFEYSQGERPIPSSTYKTLQKEYRDVGIVSGFKYLWFSNNNLHMVSKINYTFLPYTHASFDPKYYWDKNPSRHMLSFSIGLGFNN